MNLKWWMVATAALILATPPALGAYDVDAYEEGGDDATISRLSQRTAWKYPPFQWSLCFLLAELCTHLFTTRAVPRPFPDWLTIPALVILPFLVVVVCLIAAVRSPGGLPATGPPVSSASALAKILVALALGALSGARILHQTGD